MPKYEVKIEAWDIMKLDAENEEDAQEQAIDRFHNNYAKVLKTYPPMHGNPPAVLVENRGSTNVKRIKTTNLSGQPSHSWGRPHDSWGL